MRARPNPCVRHGGVALHRDFLAAGYSPEEVVALVRAGHIVRVRRGAYADAALWRTLDDVGRHLLRARAVLAVLEPPAALSHASAAIALGLPVWGAGLDSVHVTRAGRSQSRREAGVVHHNGVLPADQVVEVGGLRVTRVDRTVLDLARLAGFEAGVVTADAALHSKLVTVENLRVLAIAQRDWPGSRVASRVLAFADGLAESVGESRTRVLFHDQGLPKPRLQVEIRSRGRLLGRVDLLIEEARTVVEFDGRMKYQGGESGDPREVENVLWAEKRREDDIRGDGYEFCRVIWPDLDRPVSTARRIRAAIDRGLGRGFGRSA